MMVTKYIIKMKIPTLIDYYCRTLRIPLFDYRRPKAKRY